MTVSDTAIANLALTALGATKITDFSDDTTEAKMVTIHYDHARDAVLEAREWTFAIRRAVLAKLTTPPAWGYSSAHQIPKDTIRVIEMRAHTSSHVNYTQIMNPEDWRREGDQIVSNATTMMCRYLARIEDPNRYTPAFVHCLGARLAYEMAVPLTQSRRMQEDMFNLYEAKLAMAASTDGMQGRSEQVRSSQLTGVRGIGASFATGVV